MLKDKGFWKADDSFTVKLTCVCWKENKLTEWKRLLQSNVFLLFLYARFLLCLSPDVSNKLCIFHYNGMINGVMLHYLVSHIFFSFCFIPEVCFQLGNTLCWVEDILSAPFSVYRCWKVPVSMKNGWGIEATFGNPKASGVQPFSSMFLFLRLPMCVYVTNYGMAALSFPSGWVLWAWELLCVVNSKSSSLDLTTFLYIGYHPTVWHHLVHASLCNKLVFGILSQFQLSLLLTQSGKN